MKQTVKITILCEDQAKMGFKDKIFLAQHGFSAFVEAGKRVLFDLGATDVFAHNAELLGIDLNSTELIVLSHGHWDHTDGLKVLCKKTYPKMSLLAHPGVFADRHKATGEYNGIFSSRSELADKFDLILSKEPYRITDTIFFLGEIPRMNDFEAQKTSFYFLDKGERREDFILDDTALVLKTLQGLVIVTGCSHSGVCNIIEYARQVTEEQKVHAVVGGFHLLGDPVQREKTIEFFRRNQVDHLYPMHCTDLPSLSGFYEAFGMEKICAGDSLVFDG